MSTIHVAVLDDYQHAAQELADWASLGSDVRLEFFHDHVSDETGLAERLQPFTVVAAMRERSAFRRSLIERLPNLRLLITTGMRNASIDTQACIERGVTLCGTVSSGLATAEMTWGLILAVARRIPQEDHALRLGHWQTTLGTELRGKTLGIVGLGKLGSEVARFGFAFGMDVIAWSQNLTAERAAEFGATRVEKDQLFARADVVSIHLVWSKRTRGLIGAADFARMKTGAYFINTSRAPIVETDALVAALHEGRIAGAGIDVYDDEPLSANHPLRDAPNTVLTPHLGYVTRETYAIWFPQIVEDIAAWRAGDPVRVISPPQ